MSNQNRSYLKTLYFTLQSRDPNLRASKCCDSGKQKKTTTLNGRKRQADKGSVWWSAISLDHAGGTEEEKEKERGILTVVHYIKI